MRIGYEVFGALGGNDDAACDGADTTTHPTVRDSSPPEAPGSEDDREADESGTREGSAAPDDAGGSGASGDPGGSRGGGGGREESGGGAGIGGIFGQGAGGASDGRGGAGGSHEDDASSSLGGQAGPSAGGRSSGAGGASGASGSRTDAGIDGSAAGGAREDSGIVDGAPPGDASSPDADAAIKDAAPRNCNWMSGPPEFGERTSVGAPNTSFDDENPVLTYDGLTLFYSTRSAVSERDVYQATRSSLSESFGAGVAISAVNTTKDESHFFVGPSGLEAFFVSNRSGSLGGTDVFRATRSSSSGAWSSSASLANVNSKYNEYDPYLESDGLTLWFSPEDGSGQQHIVHASRATSASAFGAPVAATTLNGSSGKDSNLSLTADGLVITFVSNRDSTYRLYYAVRSARGATFGAPSVVAALDSHMSAAADSYISPDGCEVYFVATGMGGRDIYFVRAMP